MNKAAKTLKTVVVTLVILAAVVASLVIAIRPSGGGPKQCNDGIDNDNDGLIDLADSGCSSKFDNDEHSSGLVCDNGIDEANDADTLKDYQISGGDPGCMSPTDSDERDGACDDLVDNDGDGLVDYPNDPECANYADREHECTDTDGGIVYNTAGIVSGSFGGAPFSNADSCIDNITLKEYYCDPYKPQSITTSCGGNSTGQCVNGACV